MAELIRNSLSSVQQAVDREHRFLWHASHELRTPISTIRSNIELQRKLTQNREELAEEMTYLLSGKPVTTQISTRPYHCTVPLVPARIILGNLIRNAYQHCWEGAVVIDQHDNHITITNPVESSAPELMENLPEQTGYGLGLELTTTLSKWIGWLVISPRPATVSEARCNAQLEKPYTFHNHDTQELDANCGEHNIQIARSNGEKSAVTAI